VNVRRLLVDNDALVKLAHWQLLEAIPRVTGIPWERTSALVSLKFRAQKADRKLFRSAEVAQAVFDRANLMAEMPELDATIVSRLQGMPGIDAGEITLIAALCADPEALLLTGDKRALEALANCGHVDIHARIAGRIIVVEHILQSVLETEGAATLAQAVEQHRDLDTAVRCAVPLPPYATQDGIAAGLGSYLADAAARASALGLPTRWPP
jgi:hypothetical protein